MIIWIIIITNKQKAFGLKIIEEPQFLRHFTSKFEVMTQQPEPC